MRRFAHGLMHHGCTGLGVFLVLVAFGGQAGAIDVSAPELSPGAMASAMTLLAAGALLVGNRVRRRK